MWLDVLTKIAKTYGVLWLTAVGGFVGANVAGVVAMFCVEQGATASAVRPWVHGGWLLGTVLFFVGAVLGRLRFQSGVAAMPTSSTGEVTVDESHSSTSAEDDAESRPATLMGAVKNTLGGGVLGGLIGLVFGCSLIVFLMSAAYSPFGLDRATASIEVVRDRTSNSAVERNVHQLKHPLIPYVCGIPAALGVVAGCLAAGVLTMRYGNGDVTERCPTQAVWLFDGGSYAVSGWFCCLSAASNRH